MNAIARTTLNPRQSAAISAVEEQIARLNRAVAQAVDAGLIVEVTRASRHHSPQCAWGDQLSPKISSL